jgi:hypothetical protein
VIYDTSGNVTPLDLTATQITNWQAPGMRGDFTDVGFTSPLVEIPLVIAADCAAGTHNITLRRTRVGIPARVPPLSDAVLYDDGVLPVTVAVETEAVTIGPDVDCQVPSYPHSFDLLLSGTYDGAATVVSDDANLVPTSPVTIVNGVAVVACVASADVTDATVTATGPGGDTDACSVTITEAADTPVPLSIGPDQSLRSSVTSVYLHITGPDGAATVTSSPAFGLSGLPASVTISGNEADLTLTKMTPGTYTITVTQGATMASCTVVIAAAYVASDTYDLVQDIADVVEAITPASGNCYHYDEVIITEDGRLDSEDRVFGVRVMGATEGPIVGGKTVTVEVAVVAQVQASPADIEAMQNYLTQYAEWPDYVGAVVCNDAMITPLAGGDLIIYTIEVILG